MANRTQTRTRRGGRSTAKRTPAKKSPATKATRFSPAAKATRETAASRTTKRLPATKKTATKGATSRSPATKATAKRAPASKASTTTRTQRSRNETPNTPAFEESRLYRMRVDELRDMAKRQNIAGTSAMRKDDLVKTLSKAAGGMQRMADRRAKKTAPARQAPPTKAAKAAKAGQGGKAGVRQGSASSRSLKYAQVIQSTEDKPDRPGRSLVTTNHDVIRKWAQERDAIPSTVEGTKQRETIAVLRFDFPLGGRGGGLRHVSWDEWFKAFDGRQLNFIYQEQLTNGRQSNFFRLENPGREDG